MRPDRAARYSNPRHPIWWLLLFGPFPILGYVVFRIWAGNNPEALRKFMGADKSPEPAPQETPESPVPPRTVDGTARKETP